VRGRSRATGSIMDAPMLTIDVWHNEIAVPRDHPAPWRVRDHVERVTRHAQAKLGEALSGYLERRNGEVILIRTIELDLDLDVACDPTDAARALASRLTRQLVDSIESGAPQVLRFPSQAAYRGRFIADLATGNAWGRWYYASFDGLRVLAPSAAIRTLLTDDAGTETLAAIAEAQWPSLATVLGDADVWRVLDALATHPTTSDTADLASAWLDAAGRSSLRGIDRPPVLALMLLATIARRGYAVDATAVASAEAVGLAMSAFRRGNRAVLDWLTRANAGELRSAHGDRTAIARTLVRMADPDGAALRALARSTCAKLDSAATVAPTTMADAPIVHSSCAPGLIVLLDEIDALFEAGLASCLPIAPDADTNTVRAAATLAVLGCAAGAAQAQAVWHNAAWRAVLGLSDYSWSDFAQLLATRSDPAEACQAFAQHAILHLRAPVMRVRCCDEPALFASHDTAEGTARIGRIEFAVDSASGMWCTQPLFSGRRPRGDDDAPAFDGHGVVETTDLGPTSLAQRLVVTRAAQRDWRDLDSPLLRDGCPPAWQALFIACAQFVWRCATQRVPGMLRATLPYLRANLLGMHGGCEARGPDHWHWRVARPPLHVLIAMTGLSRCARTRYGGREQRIDVEWI
jgi:hypothetical protein